jgi:hypothetical protein
LPFSDNSKILEFSCSVGLITQKAVQKYIKEQNSSLLVSNHLQELYFGQAKNNINIQKREKNATIFISCFSSIIEINK